MITRQLTQRLREAIGEYPAVVLLGPRQVGKTTLALEVGEQLPSVHLDLEDRFDLAKAREIEKLHAVNAGKLLILDEVQRMPELFEPLRVIIDRQRRKGHRSGQFLLLGPASIAIINRSSETLAGRVAYLELFPLNALEYATHARDALATDRLWLRGGFPDSVLAKDDATSLDRRFNFIRSYLERDLPQLGPRIPAETLQRFWTMLAHGQGTAINASKLAANMDVSNVTVTRYIDLLVDLLLVRKVQPYSGNIKKRLVKSPRVYVRDSGLAHALLNIGTLNELLGHPVVGKSWEGFVVENIASVLPPRANLFYYRTTGGAEVDLVVEFGGGAKWVIEIKRGSSLKLARGFHEACHDLAPKRKFLVHGRSDPQFPLADGITAISLKDLMAELMGMK